MKITLSILLGLSVLLNLFLVGCHCLSSTEQKTITYDGMILSYEQIEALRIREEPRPDVRDVIDQYHIFIRNVKGKKLIVLDKE